MLIVNNKMTTLKQPLDIGPDLERKLFNPPNHPVIWVFFNCHLADEKGKAQRGMTHRQ